MILMAIGFIVIKINPDLMLEFEELFDFAFELVNNYQDTGELQSGTTDKLLSMWETLPDTLKTWLIGDARWTAADGRHYYMEVDVGYLRNLWYFGIIGTVIYLIYNLKTLKLILNRKCVFDAKVGKYAWIFLFIYTLILNTKGPIDLVFYIIPFLFIDRYSNNCRLD